MENSNEMDELRARRLDAAIEDVLREEPAAERDRHQRERLPALRELRRESPTGNQKPVASTLRFRDGVTLARFVEFARRRGCPPTVGKEGVWTVTTTYHRNKTERTRFIGAWGEESVER